MERGGWMEARVFVCPGRPMVMLDLRAANSVGRLG